MTDQTRITKTTQREDTPNPNSQKFQHTKTVSSLADGHRYALKYFPEELQALLNIASLKLDERIPGHFGTIIGWQKASKAATQHPRVTMKPLEILWDLEHHKIVLSDPFPFSGSTWAIVDINGEEALPVLRRRYDLVKPFSTMLTAVDNEHLALLEVFFRYNLLVQGFDDAIEGFKNEFWLCFEKLCRHVAEQASVADAQEKKDGADESEKTEASTPTQIKDVNLDSLLSEADTSEHVHQDSSTAPETKQETVEATGDHIEAQLAKALEEAAGWKKAYEGEKNFVAKLKFVLRKHVARYDKLGAKLKEREGDVEEWKEKYEAFCRETREY
ncbi:hypothetical protein J4E93_003069 [Alternaria ventricosa]|uniref:uncharacterized protein n=1 Tax=Alternaria ventricosa TaxID=1187951 RepID=UPI0020C36192|nr:uncharacterized protein J4E93_003069 [Alternaria ventricosa]KAI4650712.1 hypothetical protein J4E93_003069 [Alternaria ventricosa]